MTAKPAKASKAPKQPKVSEEEAARQGSGSGSAQARDGGSSSSSKGKKGKGKGKGKAGAQNKEGAENKQTGKGKKGKKGEQQSGGDAANKEASGSGSVQAASFTMESMKEAAPAESSLTLSGVAASVAALLVVAGVAVQKLGRREPLTVDETTPLIDEHFHLARAGVLV